MIPLRAGGVRMSVEDQRIMALYREIEQLKGKTLTDKGLDDTDFKTRETGITYDQAGMDLVGTSSRLREQ